jgi:hypothetical protein
MRKPRVVMFGGRFTFVQDWARAAASAGAEVSLVDGLQQSSSVGRSSDPNGEVVVRDYSGSRQLRPSRYFWPLNERLLERSIRRFTIALGADTGP